MSTETVAFNLGAGLHAKPIEDACIRFGIDTELRKAHFLGQMAVESRAFTATIENLNYRRDLVRDTFGAHRISDEQLAHVYQNRLYPADKELFANCIYGGEFGRIRLGNTEPGDGWRFIGRGLKQLTGRDNYRRCSQALFGDDTLLQTPELLEQEPWASLSAGWFWMANGLNVIADTDSVRAVTKKVNGGYNGLAARERWTLKAKSEFERIGNS